MDFDKDDEWDDDKNKGPVIHTRVWRSSHKNWGPDQTKPTL